MANTKEQLSNAGHMSSISKALAAEGMSEEARERILAKIQGKNKTDVKLTRSQVFTVNKKLSSQASVPGTRQARVVLVWSARSGKVRAFALGAHEAMRRRARETKPWEARHPEKVLA